MVVWLLAVSLAVLCSPPPDTVAVLVTLDGAFTATFTVSVIRLKLAPTPIDSLRVHGPAGCVQFQLVPLIAVAVSPEGTVSLTETWPLVGPFPELVTGIVYVAPFCPCVKLPTCVFVTVRSGEGLMVV